MEYLSTLANYVLQNVVSKSPAFNRMQGLSKAIQMFLDGGY